MKVYIVTCARYYTDGPGGLYKVFASEESARKYILDNGGFYDDFDKIFLNEDLQLYYHVIPMNVES